jgi:hypothetical protein
MCQVHNVKKMLLGAVILPGKWGKLLKETVLAYGEELLTLVWSAV